MFDADPESDFVARAVGAAGNHASPFCDYMKFLQTAETAL